MSKNTNPKDHPVMNLAGADKAPLVAVLQKFEIIRNPSEDQIQNAIQAYDELTRITQAAEEAQTQLKRQSALAKIQPFVDQRRIMQQDVENYVEFYLSNPERTMDILNRTRPPEPVGGEPILGLGVPGMAKGPQGKYTEEGFLNKLESIKDPAERVKFFRENKNNISR